MIDKLNYREAMSGLGTAVNVITSEGKAGLAGCTVSAVCSVTDEPPTLLVCINRASKNNAVIRENRNLCVNILAGDQSHIAMQFASKDVAMESRFAAATWDRLETGAPALVDGVAALDCEVTSANEVGTHTVFYCEIKAIRSAADREGLMYFGRDFHRLPRAARAA
ncbi:flavin reductase [Bordetella avium]|uniref:4-hydroxyphenylacetate 3-monooxygenase,reductase component n=1 Tax=Bordetella avium (strain 197N) TaxID=360910 RepID=Q2KVH8_BORA1|nr:flavin reductase [Bordetella avium]AZY50825.1 flavin reductase [Bordetella avium]AZY54213.1 flavin reductase [Bordetella avium]RIQ14297.1 flavin reductase [Bordetella avium]RIQ17187.1 flavin reductase [Bordetella avium]RIQ36646.1 flavin reductase [Bordetella avium]